MEFQSIRSIVELRVTGPEADDGREVSSEKSEIDIDVEVLVGDAPDAAKSFIFRAEVLPGARLVLGPRLAGSFITVPCDLYLNYGQEVELTSPIEISAKSIHIDSRALLVRPTSRPNGSKDVFLSAHEIISSAESVSASGANLCLMADGRAGLSYPLIPFAQERTRLPQDPLLKEKYLRLRRILLEFRSHGRGSLAKFREKIESERVIRNDLGRSILGRLIRDRVLSLRGNHYHLDPQSMRENIGVTWQDLRKGLIPESLIRYLQSIE